MGVSADELQITEWGLTFLHSLTCISMHANKPVNVHTYLSQHRIQDHIVLSCSGNKVEDSQATVARKWSREEKVISLMYIAVIYRTLLMLITTLKVREQIL